MQRQEPYNPGYYTQQGPNTEYWDQQGYGPPPYVGIQHVYGAPPQYDDQMRYGPLPAYTSYSLQPGYSQPGGYAMGIAPTQEADGLPARQLESVRQLLTTAGGLLMATAIISVLIIGPSISLISHPVILVLMAAATASLWAPRASSPQAPKATMLLGSLAALASTTWIGFIAWNISETFMYSYSALLRNWIGLNYQVCLFLLIAMATVAMIVSWVIVAASNKLRAK